MVVWIILSFAYLALIGVRWVATRFFHAPILEGARFRRWERHVPVAFLLSAVVHFLGSEFWYANYIQPKGISTIADYYERFGEPQRVRAVQRQGKTFYHFHGHLPPWYVLAVPSEPPAYVFDGSGRYLEWCRDPGEDQRYWKQWPSENSEDIDGGVFREGIRVVAETFFPSESDSVVPPGTWLLCATDPQC